MSDELEFTSQLCQSVLCDLGCVNPSQPQFPFPQMVIKKNKTKPLWSSCGI